MHESVGVIGEPSIGVREYRLERLRLYNQTPKRKEAKIEYMRKRRVLQADTLNVASIAMEDPTYTPEVVHPATEPSTVTTCDWVIPEFVRTPFLPAQTQTEDVGSFDMSTEAIRRKHHVPRGERQAILARRNKQFQASIARNVTTLNGDTIGDANNNGNYYPILNGSCTTTIPYSQTKRVFPSAQCSVPCQAATLPTNGSAGITEQGNEVEHTQEKPRVISNGNCKKSLFRLHISPILNAFVFYVARVFTIQMMMMMMMMRLSYSEKMMTTTRDTYSLANVLMSIFIMIMIPRLI